MRLGDSGIRTDFRAAENGLSKVSAPLVVASLAAFILSPQDVIGGVDGAVLVVVGEKNETEFKR